LRAKFLKYFLREEAFMPIITISRGSYSRGKEVAEKLAKKLDYECISREVLIEASGQFNISEIKLVRAIHDSPTILEQFSYGKEKYVAYIRAALLKRVQKNNVIYHGLAGHFFLQNISHVLKVRIIADLKERIEEEMKRENITFEKARHIIKKDDEERRKWSHSLYDTDPWDPNYYDLILHIKTLSVDDVVDVIFHTAQKPCYQTTLDSQKSINDLFIVTQVQAALIKDLPMAHINIRDDTVYVYIDSPPSQLKHIVEQVEELTKGIIESKNISVKAYPCVPTAIWGR